MKHLIRAALVLCGGIAPLAYANAVLTFEEQTTEKFPVRVTLGHGYSSVDEKGTRHIIDFDKRRMYEVRLSDKTYRDISLYTVLGFSMLEIGNRLNINDALDAAKLKNDAHAPALIEHSFGVTIDGQDTVIDNAHSQGATVFSWKGKELMSVSDEMRPLPKEYQSAWLRWMRYGFGGHPQIYRDLGKRTGVPASMRILRADPPPGQTITLRVTNVATEADAPYSLAGFTHAEPDKQPYRVLKLFPADRKSEFAARVEAAKKDRDAAVSEGRMLDAALAHFAYSLASGDTGGDWFAQTRDQVAGDPDTRLLVTSLSAKDAEQASAGVKVLQGLRAKNTSPHAYMLDLFAANHEVALKHPAEAERLFTAALASNPYLTGAWFDLAKVYYGTFRVQEAWACWDAARSINPTHPFAKEIDTLERDLVADHPEFF